MEILPEILNRRSIRKFKNDPVSKDQIRMILQAGIEAPSAKNNQQWRFEVFTGEEKDKLVTFCVETFANKEKPKMATSTVHSFKIMKEAPVVIVVLNIAEWGQVTPEIQSIGACIQNMLLQAEHMGLGSLWICDVLFVNPELEKYLNTSFKLEAAIAIGHKGENPKRRPRMEIDEVTRWH